MSITYATIAICSNGLGAAAATAAASRSIDVGPHPFLHPNASAACFEKAPQQGTALLGANSAEYVQAMRQSRFAGQIEHTATRARLLIPGAKDDPGHSGIDGGADAHGARLQRDIQSCHFEPVVP